MKAVQVVAPGEAIFVDVPRPAPMLTHHLPFVQVFRAYELQHTRGEGAIKIIIEMPDPRD